MYAISRASGHTGCDHQQFLLKGRRLRVRPTRGGLERLYAGATEAVAASSDAASSPEPSALADAAYLMLPPITSREDQERHSDAIAKAVEESGLRHARCLPGN